MQTNSFFAALLGALVGAAAIATIQAHSAGAQQPRQYRECVVYSLDFARRSSTLERNAKPIARGWTPVGAGDGSVTLCR